MDPLIERFERILRSYFQNGTIPGKEGGGIHRDDWNRFADEQDFRDAFAELDDFLKTGTSSGTEDTGSFDFQGTGRSGGSFRSTGEPAPPEMLREDYKELGVRFGAPFAEVRNAYRELMRTHHPDRHGSDVVMQERATRKAQRLNFSFQRIRAWEEAKKAE